MTAHELLGAVLELPAKERARIARHLLLSLDERDEDAIGDSELIVELDRRREQALRGEVHMLGREEFEDAIARRRAARRAP